MKSESPQHPDVRSEPMDVNGRGVALAVIGLAICLILSLAATRLVESSLHSATRRPVLKPPLFSGWGMPADETEHPFISGEAQSLIQDEENFLSQYAWLSREKGQVRIPIEQAMDLVVQNGFPEFKSEEPREIDSGVGIQAARPRLKSRSALRGKESFVKEFGPVSSFPRDLLQREHTP